MSVVEPLVEEDEPEPELVPELVVEDEDPSLPPVEEDPEEDPLPVLGLVTTGLTVVVVLTDIL